MFEGIKIAKKNRTIVFDSSHSFRHTVASRVFTVELFGIRRWKANEMTMVSKLKSDAYSSRNCEMCLNESKS